MSESGLHDWFAEGTHRWSKRKAEKHPMQRKPVGARAMQREKARAMNREAQRPS